MRVRLFPEKTWAELGAKRWTVEWWTLRKGVKPDADTSQENEDFDYDRDLVSNYRAFKTKAAALKCAEREAGNSFWGAATVQGQVVAYWDDEDYPNIAEWQDVGEAEEVLPSGEVVDASR